MASEDGIVRNRSRAVLAGLLAAGLGSALAASAFGSPGGGAKFGVYTALEQNGADQLQVILSVSDPAKKLSVTAQCANLGPSTNVVEVWNSPYFALHNNSFSFSHKVKISKLTEAKTMAVLSSTTYKGLVTVSGAFAHNKATGHAKIGGSSCSHTGYTAKRKPGPTL